MKLLLVVFALTFFSQVCSEGIFLREPATPVVCGNSRCESYLGESCTTCPQDCGVCPSCNNICGNKRCEPSENGCTCPEDCGVCCVDGLCRNGETAITCPEDCTTDLVGHVEDKFAVVPLPGATVTCQSEQTLLGNTVTAPTKTDENGTFRFASLPAGYYTCTASLINYNTGSVNFLFQAGLYATPLPEVRIQLVNQMGSISGSFRDTLKRSYLRHVNVTCRTNTTSSRTKALINKPYYKWSSATYFLNDLTGGDYICEAKKPGYGTVSKSAFVTVGSNTVVDFAMTPFPVVVDGTVRLRFLNPIRWKPLNGTVSCISTTGITVSTSIVNGQFLFDNLLPKTTYWCSISSSYPAKCKKFDICGEEPGTRVHKDLWCSVDIPEPDGFGHDMTCIKNTIHRSLQYADSVPGVDRKNITGVIGYKLTAVYMDQVVAQISDMLPANAVTNSTNINATGLTELVFNYFAAIGETLFFSYLKFYSPVAEVYLEEAGLATVSGYLKGVLQNCKTLEYSAFYGMATFTLQRVPSTELPCQWRIATFTYTKRASLPLPQPLVL